MWLSVLSVQWSSRVTAVWNGSGIQTCLRERSYLKLFTKWFPTFTQWHFLFLLDFIPLKSYRETRSMKLETYTDADQFCLVWENPHLCKTGLKIFFASAWICSSSQLLRSGLFSFLNANGCCCPHLVMSVAFLKQWGWQDGIQQCSPPFLDFSPHQLLQVGGVGCDSVTEKEDFFFPPTVMRMGKASSAVSVPSSDM